MEITKFLENENKHYFSNNKDININKVREIFPNDMALYHIEELTFEDKAPRKEALENVISALRFKGMNFLYLVIGDKKGVHFYLGAVRDLNYKKELEMTLNDVGEEILKPSINGNFRGSKINGLENQEKLNIINKINSMRIFGSIEGVPGIDQNKESFQGVDRLVDVMLGEEFVIAIMASPLDSERIKEIENNIYEIYDKITPLSKKNVQKGNGISTSISNTEGISNSINITKSKSESKTEGKNVSNSKSDGTSKSNTVGNSNSESESRGENKTNSKSDTIGKNTGESNTIRESSKDTSKSSGESSSNQKGESIGRNESQTKTKGNSVSTTQGTSNQVSTTEGMSTSTSETSGESKSEGSGNSKTKGESEVKSENENISVEHSIKLYQEWIKYFDEVILPRLDYGKSKGLFVMNTFICANNRASLIKLGHTIKALYSGKSGNKVPLKLFEVEDEVYIDNLKKFQVPIGKFKNIDKDNLLEKSALSQDVSDEYIKLGNVISTNELSLIAGFPQKEIVGLELKEQVEFGLNFNEVKEEDNIILGNLVQSGRELDIKVSLNKENLNKHIFITGVTGSGKTTTCQKILLDSNMPFMVIEPAKTEYRILTKKFDELLIFTLGRDGVAPFRINPFEFYPHENISSRVDMIKATLESAFDMEAAIPQIIESSIYECYENYGWNIATNENINYENPFEDGVFSFPTLSDLIKQIERNVKNQGFDDRLKNDYIGSIKARLQGLMIGSKGLMLNCKRSINFKELVNKKVILELEEIRNGSEKSLLMGFVLTNLNEAIKASYLENQNFKHITLVEEAHRLLSKYEYGDSLSKKQGVEVFADMLAEVRKYGESLIIVDQIPGKLTPEILKNTNTKIVHKIFAEDDKRAIGNTMALSEEQMDFLSNLDVGRAIVFSQGFGKAIQVQIDQLTNTTEKEIISENIIKENALEFYRNHYKSGVLEGLEYLKTEPTLDQVKMHLKFLQTNKIIKEFELLIENNKSDFEFKEYINSLDKFYTIDFLSNFIGKKLYRENKETEDILSIRINSIKMLLDAIIKDNLDVRNYINYMYIQNLKIK